MTVKWFQGKCYDHGGWDIRVWGEKCPCCAGKLGRKKKGKNDE